MKIISLNTWAGAIFEPLQEFLKNYAKKVDIFCLQEIYSDAYGKEDPHPDYDWKLDLFQRIENILKDTHTGFFRPAWGGYYGIALFVKKEVVVLEEGEVFTYVNNDPEKRGSHSRNLQYLRMRVGTTELLVVNLHGLWNGMGKTDTEDRLNQSRAIRTFVDRFDCPKIIVGDFNLNPDTESLAIIEKDMRNLIKEHGITSTRTSFYTKEGKFADYAIVSPEVKVVDFKVLPDEVSDHAALYLEIQ